MLSAAARPALRAMRTPLASAQCQQMRSVHFDNVVGSNTPFSYKSGSGLAIKMIAFCGFGFATPFLAASYQMYGYSLLLNTA
ncbi:BQ2448_1691 [Microbotryum intermedium]|uniref:Cytochrome c oxidase subunit 8, mitochondrial n=1 Tax=Microbotryum intermedium TaxID=269621 RepID=A0A238FAV5_9BASI|nr:BQ2448_1691 [Microbotryum intermedium]